MIQFSGIFCKCSHFVRQRSDLIGERHKNK